jgi:thiamine biosynthesis lipoprotein
MHISTRKNEKRKAWPEMQKIFWAVFCLSLVFSSCKQTAPARTEFVLGTICTVNLYDGGTDAIYTEIFDRLKTLESILSANREGTNLMDINAGAGMAPVKAAHETIEILSEALLFSKKTDGLFDPSIGPLVKAWNIGTDNAAVPTDEKRVAAIALVDFRKVAIDEQAGTVFLREKGMRLDLGAIAKGYAADQVVQIIAKHGIKRAIVDLGGNIYAYGEKKTGTPWTIGIRDPETERGVSILSLPISNESVVTSGIYERFFESNGKKYHHILNPRTGFPEDNELMSVSIVATNSMLADALSTSTFLLGTEKGLALIESTDGTEAIFINKNHEIRTSKGLKGKLKLLDSNYRLVDRN